MRDRGRNLGLGPLFLLGGAAIFPDFVAGSDIVLRILADLPPSWVEPSAESSPLLPAESILVLDAPEDDHCFSAGRQVRNFRLRELLKGERRVRGSTLPRAQGFSASQLMDAPPYAGPRRGDCTACCHMHDIPRRSEDPRVSDRYRQHAAFPEGRSGFQRDDRPMFLAKDVSLSVQDSRLATRDQNYAKRQNYDHGLGGKPEGTSDRSLLLTTLLGCAFLAAGFGVLIVAGVIIETRDFGPVVYLAGYFVALGVLGLFVHAGLVLLMRATA